MVLPLIGFLFISSHLKGSVYFLWPYLGAAAVGAGSQALPVVYEVPFLFTSAVVLAGDGMADLP